MPAPVSYREITTRDTGEGATPSSGFWRILVALGAATAICCLPYVIPGLQRFRAWVPGDKVPFSKVFRSDSSGPVVAEASGGLEFDKTLNKREKEILSLFDKKPAGRAGLPAPATRPKKAPPPVGEPEGKAQPRAPTITLPPEATSGVKVLIEDPSGSMKTFYEALARTARGVPGAVTRIGHWSDSAVAQDGLTSVARRLLQKQFGDAGHGFILATRATRFYHHQGVRFTTRDWKRYRLTHANASDHRYGYGGVRARGNKKSAATFGTVDKGEVGRAVSRFEIFHLKGPGQGSLELRLDSQKPRRITAAAPAWEDAVYAVEVPDGPHLLRLRVPRGTVNVYGVALEREGPGVVYDTLGLVGLFGARFGKLDPGHWKRQLSLRRPDLMIILLGGNTLGFPFWSAAKYEKGFVTMIKRFREGRPEASCLVISPLDHGERHRGTIRSKVKLKPMIEIQRRVALANGCAFFSLFDAMGGEGTMGRWARSKPRLVSGDLTHVSRYGARVLGALIYKSLMVGFSRHLDGGDKR